MQAKSIQVCELHRPSLRATRTRTLVSGRSVSCCLRAWTCHTPEMAEFKVFKSTHINKSKAVVAGAILLFSPSVQSLVLGHYIFPSQYCRHPKDICTCGLSNPVTQQVFTGTYCMPGTALGIRETVNDKSRISAVLGLTCSLGRCRPPLLGSRSGARCWT